MPEINKTRTVFIRESTPLPTLRSMESEQFLPGWRIVKNVDRQALTREIEGANWNFFYLAGEIRTTVFGRERLGPPRPAVKRIVEKQEGHSFRCNWRLQDRVEMVSGHSSPESYRSLSAYSTRYCSDVETSSLWTS
jgi:hypothetical protein